MSEFLYYTESLCQKNFMMLDFLLPEWKLRHGTRSVSLHLANRKSTEVPLVPGVRQWQSLALLANSLSDVLYTAAYTEV
jgi:hypothetical protein